MALSLLNSSSLKQLAFKGLSVAGVEHVLLLYRISKQEHVVRTTVVSCCIVGVVGWQWST